MEDTTAVDIMVVVTMAAAAITEADMAVAMNAAVISTAVTVVTMGIIRAAATSGMVPGTPMASARAGAGRITMTNTFGSATRLRA